MAPYTHVCSSAFSLPLRPRPRPPTQDTEYVIPKCQHQPEYLDYIEKNFPQYDKPEAFGMHANANLTFSNNQAKDIFGRPSQEKEREQSCTPRSRSRRSIRGDSDWGGGGRGRRIRRNDMSRETRSNPHLTQRCPVSRFPDTIGPAPLASGSFNLPTWHSLIIYRLC